MIKNTIIGVAMMIFSTASAVEMGKASYYSIRSNGGTHTASGEKLRDDSMTAAHKTLPFGTLVEVTNLKNNKKEIVRITNRGPYIKGRIIDVTVGVAEKLGFKKDGVVNVKIKVIGKVKK
jgi:rare lipoprotein A